LTMPLVTWRMVDRNLPSIDSWLAADLTKRDANPRTITALRNVRIRATSLTPSQGPPWNENNPRLSLVCRACEAEPRGRAVRSGSPGPRGFYEDLYQNGRRWRDRPVCRTAGSGGRSADRGPWDGG